MTEDALKSVLEELKEQLNGVSEATEAPAPDSPQWARIQQLLQMAEQQLEHPDRDAEIDTLLAEVKDHVTQFISRHPHLDAVFRQVTSILSNLGI